MENVIPNDVKLYIQCMDDARARLNFVKYLPSRNASTGNQGIDQDLVFLQLRKVLEQVAFASLVANREIYSAVRKKFATYWKAKALLDELREVNPDFWPMAIKKPVMQPNGVKHCDLAYGALTKDEFITLYDIAGDFLHVRNPFSTKDPVVRMPYSIKDWIIRIQTLLELHVVRLVNGKLWIFTVPEQGEVRAVLAEPTPEPVAVL